MSKKEQRTEGSLFIFLFKEKITQNSKPDKNIYYDKNSQVWCDKKENKIFVDTLREQKSSEFGETMITKTSEGTDQSEIIKNSDFGETTLTFTSEGADTNEHSDIIRSSDFGETMITRTFEGADQREAI